MRRIDRMSKDNHYRGWDVLLDTKVNNLCNCIDHLAPQNLNNISDFMEDILTSIERRKIRIVRKTKPKPNCREFPQFDMANGVITAWYFAAKDTPKSNQIETILMQMSIISVLVFCGSVFVDALPADTTILSFCRNWPECSNHATQLYNLLSQKFK